VIITILTKPSTQEWLLQGVLKRGFNKPLFVHFFTLHKALHHAAMLWIEHLIKKAFFEQLDGVLI
jgi:hypothetical protein